MGGPRGYYSKQNKPYQKKNNTCVESKNKNQTYRGKESKWGDVGQWIQSSKYAG
jgi:hypothetical protein